MGDRIKKHFEEEAAIYDGIILQLIPYYKEMVQAIVAAISFNRNQEIEIMDLGCGTGTITQAIQNKFAQAKFTLVDISGNMLLIAQQKVGANHCYINEDFNSFDFTKQYDVIVSSLALHHLETESDKQRFYDKIYDALKSGGVFINGDVILATTNNLQKTFIEEWVKYMNRSVDMEEIEQKWLPSYYAEDRPISLIDHIEMLINSGFVDIDIVWKYYGFSVYTGNKNKELNYPIANKIIQ